MINGKEYIFSALDEFVEVSGGTIPFALKKDGETILEGVARQFPDGRAIRFYLNRLSSSYLETATWNDIFIENEFWDYVGMLTNTDAGGQFQLINTDTDTEICSAFVVKGYGTQSGFTYCGIDGKADPRQKIFISHAGSGESINIDVNIKNPQIVFDSPFIFSWQSGTTTICYTANMDFTLSSYEGGWFSVTQTKADEFTGCLTFTYSENSGDSRNGTLCMEAEGGVTLCYPVTQKEHVTEYYFRFKTPDGQYVVSTTTAYTITWETNYPSIAYVFRGSRSVTSDTGATLTFPANTSSATTIPFSVSAYTIGGVFLGTLTWSQMPVYVPGQFDHEYLYFDILSDDDDLKWEKQATTGETIEYSKDNKQTWTAISDGKIPTSAGDRIYLRGNNTSYGDYWSSEGYSKLGGNTRFNVGGNIMSLIYGDNFEGKTRFKDACYEGYGLPNNVFYEFFMGCNVVNAYELSLPATDLPLGSQQSLSPTGVYELMFWNCTALVTAPAYLPATTLNERCYSGMFEGCSSLSTTPILPATTMDISCYSNMFKGCSSLTMPPTLPATNLAAGCYSGMFWNCASLANAPSLPATTMATNCYITMFFGCTSLTTAPSLPSTDLADNCYVGMFRYCSSLVNAPALPATTLANSCYQEMFSYCTSLEIAPVLPAINLVESCYYVMFEECSKLKYIKCLATPNSNYTRWWVRNVPEGSNGTFVKRSGTRWSAGFNGIPYGWNVIEE